MRHDSREAEFELTLSGGKIVAGTAVGTVTQLPAEEGRNWEVKDLRINGHLYADEHDGKGMALSRSLVTPAQWEQIEAQAALALTGEEEC